MEQNLEIYREILENLLDGVMVIDFSGSIEIANEAACRILELEHDQVVGRSLAEVFIQYEGFDEFTQLVLNATAEHTSVVRHVAEVHIQGNIRSITMTTSYLSSMRDGQHELIAVIAVFTDISQIRELRETELRLAKENETQHRELRKAYRDIESTNVALSQTLKKVKVARAMSLVVFVGLFLAVAGYYLQPLDPLSLRPLDALTEAVASVISKESSDEEDLVTTGIDVQTVVVSPSPLNATISLRGRLAPGHVVSVVSPIESHIKVLFAQIGQSVQKGDLLMELDTEKLQIEYRQAEVDYIKKLDNLNALQDWENSTEVADANRRYRRAKLALDNVRKRLERSNFLLDQGIIPASQQEEAQQSFESQLLDFEAATQELDAVKQKASEDELRVAALEVENAHTLLKKLENNLSLSTVVAPIAGIVQESPAGANQKPLHIGRSLTQGESLLNIANFDRIAVSTVIDEVDVGKIEADQAAWITGPGFPHLELEGRVTHVASRSNNSRLGSNSPKFDISVILDELPESHRDALRVGMSAHVTIVIYDRPEALLIPIAAVQQRNNKTWVQVVDKGTGNIEQRSVELGLTTLDSVEIVNGVHEGEEVVLSGI